MSSVGDREKSCERCGDVFARPAKFSDAQWVSRRFCSRKCAATRISMPIDELERLYVSGLSCSQIAEQCGVTKQAVRRALKASGVEIRGLSEAMKLSHNRPHVLEKFSNAARGRKHSEATKKKLRDVVGPDHPLWRSGLTLGSGGYLQFTASPANGAHAGKFLHQIVCEWKEGRKLPDGYHVHHIDGDKLNNSPDNLVSMSAREHGQLHYLERTRNVKQM